MSDSRPNTAGMVQLVIGWALVVVVGMFMLITLFTFPFVLREEGPSAIPDALAFFVPEVILFAAGFWLLRRGQRSREAASGSRDGAQG